MTVEIHDNLALRPAAGAPRIVISQPMLFPWVGMFEQIRLADVYVHYTDVQFSKGSFTNRVQIKTARGNQWLTVPLQGVFLGQDICDVKVNNAKDWRRGHLDFLAQAFAGAPYREDALDVARRAYARSTDRLAEVVIASMEAIMEYFGLDRGRRFLHSPELRIGGSGSERVLNIVRQLGGNAYVTGHGARNYLDHQAFESAGISVEYMNYQKSSYPQLHGAFTPYVSCLDLIANSGRNGARYIHSGTLDWRQFK